MKNGDMPAMPVDMTNPRFVEYAKYAESVGDKECVKSLLGLTKREQFAMAAMQGLLAKHGDDDYSPASIAEYAVKHAECLLAELEK